MLLLNDFMEKTLSSVEVSAKFPMLHLLIRDVDEKINNQFKERVLEKINVNELISKAEKELREALDSEEIKGRFIAGMVKRLESAFNRGYSAEFADAICSAERLGRSCAKKELEQHFGKSMEEKP